ncbi:MAG: hypothetical protein ABW146_18685 [Candidatus Sedimenticola sp. 6PFRAG7]
MAEINQPSFIKPVWPSRHNGNVKRRKHQPDHEQADEQPEDVRQKKGRVDQDNDKPHIDEYA